jgi:hypothetical protein
MSNGEGRRKKGYYVAWHPVGRGKLRTLAIWNDSDRTMWLQARDC